MALRLIRTGCSKPDQVNRYGNTALTWACSQRMSEVALRLIRTGCSKPDQVNRYGDTALTLACGKEMTYVALRLKEIENMLIVMYPDYSHFISLISELNINIPITNELIRSHLECLQNLQLLRIIRRRNMRPLP